MFGQIIWIQRKFHNRVIFKENRIALLIRYWDNMLEKFMEKAQDIQNKKMIAVLEHVEAVPDEIKEYVLKQFMQQT